MTALLHDWLTAAAARPYDDVGSLARVYLDRLPRCDTPDQLHEALNAAQGTILETVPAYTMASGRDPAAANAGITRAKREQAWRTVTAAADEAVRLWQSGADPAPPVPAGEHEAMQRVPSQWIGPWPDGTEELRRAYASGGAPVTAASRRG